MAKQNCGNHRGCGREPGGKRAAELGVCPAATESRVCGMHGGLNAGRVCWAVSGTLCGGQVQGTFAAKLGSGMQCEFYPLVMKEEGRDQSSARAILAKLGNGQPGG